MHEHMQSLCDSLEYAYRDLAKVNQQIRNNNTDLNPSHVEYLDRLTHTIKSLETTKAMKEAAEGSERGEYGERGAYGERGGYGMRRMPYQGGYYPGGMYPMGGYREGYAEGGYREGNYREGNARGSYGRNNDRDSAGRYADDANMREKLRDMMANTRDERTRQDLQRMMESMA